jgi:hypothetical protein
MPCVPDRQVYQSLECFKNKSVAFNLWNHKRHYDIIDTTVDIFYPVSLAEIILCSFHLSDSYIASVLPNAVHTTAKRDQVCTLEVRNSMFALHLLPRVL